MIADGIKLIVSPQKWWDTCSPEYHFNGGRLITELLMAATLPVTAVVLGHLGSFWLGYTQQIIALQRAAISFLTFTSGAVALGAAMALVLFPIARNANVKTAPEQIVLASLTIVSAGWISGIVQIIPPLLDMNPETGDFLWLLFAELAVFKTLSQGTARGLGVTRRWRMLFLVQTMTAFTLLFILFTIVPLLITRYLTGVTGETFYGPPPITQWPYPPVPNW